MNAAFHAAPSVPTSSSTSSVSGKSVAALVFGLLGLLSCTLLSPIAWYLGWSARRDIDLGFSPDGGRDIATVGMVLGIVGTALMGLIVLAILAVAALVVIGLGIAAVGA